MPTVTSSTKSFQAASTKWSNYLKKIENSTEKAQLLCKSLLLKQNTYDMLLDMEEGTWKRFFFDLYFSPGENCQIVNCVQLKSFVQLSTRAKTL